jgi:hypothetical protein
MAVLSAAQQDAPMARFRESQPAPDTKEGYHSTEAPRPTPVVPAAYPHQLPRLLHKPGVPQRRVDTPEQCEAAFADGWTLLPPKTPA